MKRALCSTASLVLATLLLLQVWQLGRALLALQAPALGVSAQLGPAILLKALLVAGNAALLWCCVRSARRA